MKEEELQQFVKDTKLYIYDNFNLNAMTDAELEEAVEALVNQQLQGLYVPIEQWALIVKQVYSAIRGFGLLDAIMADDDITEVMINGPEDIFIEKKGCLQKLDQSFESESRLEDIVQKIVGLAGREVNQANPIVDTRLPDGSRVNVVLPPIARNGATVTIRKFSKTVPIIAVTAYAFASDKEKILKNGFNGYVAKPINPTKLGIEIRTMLNKNFTLI